jgi:O-acetyl-ADP-ribose deacetylase (regulator of RNase III)
MKTSTDGRIVLRRGDITDAQVDAIVNAANTDLILGAGVAGAIRMRGGPSIQADCDAIGPIELGGAAITSGGKLRARFVIHAAGMHLGGAADEHSLRAATRNSLARAAERGLQSIAFPAIGTGIGGFPIDRCARVMLGEVRDHLVRSVAPATVEFVLFDEASLRAFERELDRIDSA